MSAELRPVRVKSGRVHHVQRTWPGKSHTRVKFACGHSTTFGVLGKYEFWSDLYAPGATITCGRCAWVLEQRSKS